MQVFPDKRNTVSHTQFKNSRHIARSPHLFALDEVSERDNGGMGLRKLYPLAASGRSPWRFERTVATRRG